MHNVIHLNLRLDPTQYIPQIRQVPGFDYIHLIKEPKFLTDLSLLNEKVYYLNQIYSPEEYVQNNKVSILHAHHGQLGVLMLPFKKKTKLPLVTSIRGVDATLANQPVGYLENMKKLFKEGERFFPVCQYLGQRIADWGCPQEKIRVLYGGVDLDQFIYRKPKIDGTQNILAVGRLVEKKGHHILMKAFSKIKYKYPKATLTIIGRGPMESELISLANKLELGDSFHLLNHLPKEKVREKMHNASLFCAASITSSKGDVEGIPNVLKEAMATGVPVISTTHAGIPELITHNKEGFLVNENDVYELAAALDYMLTYTKKWKDYSIAARKKVELQFDQKKQLVQQANYYKELLGGS